MATTCPLPCTLRLEVMSSREVKALRVAVVGAEGPQAERSFSAGVVTAPFSLGRQGDWALDARGMGAIEGFLYFDGNELFACSRELSSPIVLDGQPLGTTWERVPLGAVLIVGRSRLVVEDPTPAPDSSSTVLTDLDAMRAPPVPAPAPAARAFSTDDEHTRIGDLAGSLQDSDEAPTAFLSASVRDAVREGLSRSAAPPPLPRSPADPRHARALLPSRAEPATPEVAHVLRVDPRASSFPTPGNVTRPHADDGLFLAVAAHADSSPPDDIASLPRLSEAMPLYGSPKSARGSVGERFTTEAQPARSPLGAIAGFWRAAPPVRKATLLLMPVALAAFAFVVLAPAPAHDARSPDAERSQGSGASPPSPPASAAHAGETDVPTPRLFGASMGVARVPDGGLTLERRAADLVHTHRLDEAAAVYKELQAADPTNGAFSAATAILSPGPTRR